MITGEQLLEVFSAYNQMIWPFQIVAYILGILAIIFGFKKSSSFHKNYDSCSCIFLVVGINPILVSKCPTGFFPWLYIFRCIFGTGNIIFLLHCKTQITVWYLFCLVYLDRADMHFLCDVWLFSFWDFD